MVYGLNEIQRNNNERKCYNNVTAIKVLKDDIFLISMIPYIEDGMEYDRVFLYWDEWNRIVDFINEYRK